MPYNLTPPSDTLAYRIVKCFGGYVKLASMLGISPRLVRSWFLDGIPFKYHVDLLTLAYSQRQCEIVTPENLEATCADGQTYRARRRATRKASQALQPARPCVR